MKVRGFSRLHRQRFVLFTLWDIMRDFPADLFLTLAAMAGKYEGQDLASNQIRELLQQRQIALNTKVENTADRPEWRTTLEKVAGMCRDCELTDSALFIEKRMLPKVDTQEDLPMIPELMRRLQDEIDSLTLVQIPGDLVQYYRKEALFGEQVWADFSEANYDIEEAGNCIATDRSTAAVFHLMRVLEVALRAIAAKLQIPDPIKEADRNWGKMLEGIRRKIDANAKSGNPMWSLGQPERDFYENVYSDLSAVRTAWRNPVMHVEGIYEPDRAMHILNVVKGFMQHLAAGPKQA